MVLAEHLIMLTLLPSWHSCLLMWPALPYLSFLSLTDVSVSVGPSSQPPKRKSSLKFLSPLLLFFLTLHYHTFTLLLPQCDFSMCPVLTFLPQFPKICHGTFQPSNLLLLHSPISISIAIFLGNRACKCSLILTPSFPLSPTSYWLQAPFWFHVHEISCPSPSNSSF